MRTHRAVRTVLVLLALAMPALPSAPGLAQADPTPSAGTPDPASQLLPVDCLLPGRIRKMGRKFTYLAPRQALKTTALDCEIRGGEYVAYDRADYQTALKVWMPEAESGDAKAQNYVGEIYERGLGVPPDYTEAARWYRLAADQGYGPAQINLGQLLEQGRGVPRDQAAALELFRKASGLDQTSVPFVAAVEQPAPPVQPRADPEAERLRAELERSRAELAKTREEQERLRAERERLLAEQESARQAQAQGSDAERARIEASRAELAQRAEALAAQQARVAEQERAIEARRQEAERLEREAAAKLAAAEPPPAPPAAVELPGPTIALIDPEIPPSRGPEVVRTDAEAKERVIVGRVEAAGGLVLLSVNDAETPVADNGIFQSRVRVAADGSKVTIVAVDRQGKRAERELTLQPAQPKAAAEPAPRLKPRPPPIEFGHYHALVIGNDKYQHMPRLETAIADADAVGEVLRTRYGFQVTELRNASRYEILSALNKLRAELTEKDNLLIYYAGHGELDEANMRGNWLPVDAEPDSTANWISNASLTDLLNAMSARHILVVADSCYSGALTRSSMARLERGMTDEARIAWQEKMAEGRSRTALTSGGLAPVLDGGGGNHSVFAKAFLNVLQKNDDVLEGQRLFSEISAIVTWAAEAQRFDQLPEYAPIKFAGHESGDFFFVPSS